MLSAFFAPTATYHWFESFGARQGGSGFIPVADWQVATLVGWLRSLLPNSPIWPSAVIPGGFSHHSFCLSASETTRD